MLSVTRVFDVTGRTLPFSVPFRHATNTSGLMCARIERHYRLELLNMQMRGQNKQVSGPAAYALPRNVPSTQVGAPFSLNTIRCICLRRQENHHIYGVSSCKRRHYGSVRLVAAENTVKILVTDCEGRKDKYTDEGHKPR
jgi:hypothetical protein